MSADKPNGKPPPDIWFVRYEPDLPWWLRHPWYSQGYWPITRKGWTSTILYVLGFTVAIGTGVAVAVLYPDMAMWSIGVGAAIAIGLAVWFSRLQARRGDLSVTQIDVREARRLGARSGD